MNGEENPLFLEAAEDFRKLRLAKVKVLVVTDRVVAFLYWTFNLKVQTVDDRVEDDFHERILEACSLRVADIDCVVDEVLIDGHELETDVDLRKNKLLMIILGFSIILICFLK
jgi:hypothetical protein